MLLIGQLFRIFYDFGGNEKYYMYFYEKVDNTGRKGSIRKDNRIHSAIYPMPEKRNKANKSCPSHNENAEEKKKQIKKLNK